jgi:hypothetical protein
MENMATFIRLVKQKNDSHVTCYILKTAVYK